MNNPFSVLTLLFDWLCSLPKMINVDLSFVVSKGVSELQESYFHFGNMEIFSNK